MRWGALLLLLLLLLLAPQAAGEARAQEALGGSGSLAVPADHWVRDALRRLDAFEAARPDATWGYGTPSRAQVLATLTTLEEEAEDPRARALAGSFRERFLEELGEPSGPRLGWTDGVADLRGGRHTGALRTGAGYYAFRDPRPFEPEPRASGEVAGAVEAGPVAARARVRTDATGRPRPRELYAAAGLGGLDLWAGRRAPGFGAGMGGTVVLDGAVPLDGGGFALAEPLRLPWVFRRLGPVRFEGHLARMEESGQVTRPWFWAARASFAPHPRVGVGLNRAAFFAGEEGPPTTLRNVGLMLLGTRPDEDFESGLGRSFFSNQILSVDLRVRVRPAGVPASVYVEWGMEDGSGAWKDVPGIVAGVHVPAVPGVPALSAGLEHASFSRSCCGNPMWYRHGWFDGGWANGGVPLAHPLGGHGSEWLLHGRVDALDARLRTAWHLLYRERGAENLFAPARDERSAGVGLELAWRLHPDLDVVADASYERGTWSGAWEELRWFAGARTYF